MASWASASLARMPLGPLLVTGALGALDWGAWEWATSSNHPTVGLIAGLLMAPIALAFAWSLARFALALAQLGIRRAASEARTAEPPEPDERPKVPFDIEAQDERIAA